MNRLAVVLLYIEMAVEGLTGVAAVLFPVVVCRLLFGGDLAATGVAMARIAGISLVCFVLACWLAQRADAGRLALTALLAYNALTTVYLASLAAEGETVGVLLWPAIILHTLVAALIAIALFLSRSRGGLVRR